LHKIRALEDWMVKGGADISKLELKVKGENDRRVFAKLDIK
jgi:hypothetical protein